MFSCKFLGSPSFIAVFVVEKVISDRVAIEKSIFPVEENIAPIGLHTPVIVRGWESKDFSL